MVGRQPTGDFLTHACTLYIAILLYILFNSFKKYSNITKINFGEISQSRLHTLERITTILGIFVAVLYTYILAQTFPQLMLGSITVAEHKNEGGAADYWATLLPHFVITLGNFISPLGYLFLTLHFYFLIYNNKLKAIRYFLLSLIIVLNNLIALSRSATVQYILVYAAIFLFVARFLSKKTRTQIVKIASIIIGIVFLALMIISESRFGEYYTKQSNNEAILSETKQPLLFSTIDYFAQWEENAPIIMRQFKWGDQSWGTFNCSGLAVQIQRTIYGSDKVNDARDKKYWGLLGHQSSYFHGLVARLIYDFGFIGTIIFILLYASIIKQTGPTNEVLHFKTLLSLPITLPVCVVFWAVNSLSSLMLDLAIIYNMIIYLWITKKI